MSYVGLRVKVYRCDIHHDRLAGRVKEILESALNTNPVTEVEVEVEEYSGNQPHLGCSVAVCSKCPSYPDICPEDKQPPVGLDNYEQCPNYMTPDERKRWLVTGQRKA